MGNKQVEAGRKPDYQKMLPHPSASTGNKQWSFLGTTGPMSPSTNPLRHHLLHSEDSAQTQASSSVPQSKTSHLLPLWFRVKDVPRTAMSWGTGTTDLRRGSTLLLCGWLNKLKHTIQLYWATASQSTNHSDKPVEGYLLPILLLPAGF